MRRTCTLVCLAVLLSTAATAQAGGGEEERVLKVPYDLAAPGPFASVQDSLAGQSIHLGGTNTTVLEDEDRVEVFMLDDSTRKVPGRIAFYDAEGNALDVQDFCFHLDRPIPEGTEEIAVHPSTLPTPCPLANPNYGIAVRGHVLLTITQPAEDA